jgi:hypothetical protein
MRTREYKAGKNEKQPPKQFRAATMADGAFNQGMALPHGFFFHHAINQVNARVGGSRDSRIQNQSES